MHFSWKGVVKKGPCQERPGLELDTPQPFPNHFVHISMDFGYQCHVKSPRKPRKRKRDAETSPSGIPGDLSLCARWAALRQRILDKSKLSD